MTKEIFLQYYSRLNFGDDLFIRIFTEYFHNYDIRLLCNPVYIPKGLHSNVHVSHFSWISVAVGVFRARARNPKLIELSNRLHDLIISSAKKGTDAAVTIGGSIFMDAKQLTDEICFDVDPSLYRDFSFRSQVQPGRTAFVIGANLGPVFSQDYFDRIKHRVASYAHICLRDYASYNKLIDCPNVQYAPDVAFILEPRRVTPIQKNVVISVIDIARHTANQKVIASYYNLLASAIDTFSENGHKIILVSFCKREGDEIGIDKLLERTVHRSSVERCCYTGDIDTILDCFANASYVIASRFHSMIVAMVYGKPVFPIAYNCKTIHYLHDLRFQGKYATLDTLTDLDVRDILCNYENEIICDCRDHHKYASIQFAALLQFLESEK